MAVPVALVLSAFVVSAPAGARGRVSPDRQVLVVTANLREAYEDGRDLSRRGDMNVFVRRVLDQVPYAPDALLLQEVNARSARYVARRLTGRTPQRYIVAVKPSRTTTRAYPGRFVHTETAILLNARTMTKASRGGFVATGYGRGAARPGHPIEVKRNAHVLAREKASGVRLALASVHFTPVDRLASRRTSNFQRARWTKAVARRVARYSTPFRVIGGDFNKVRCYTGQFQACNEAAFWRALRRMNYVDTMHQAGLPAGVDYVFVRGRPVTAGLDLTYKKNAAERGLVPYYSDHNFRWALVTPR